MRGVIFLLVAAVFYTGCASSTTLAQLEQRLADRDYSFPAIGEAVETKTIASVIEYSAGKGTLPEADILLMGQVYSPWYSLRTSFFNHLFKLNNRPTVFVLPMLRQRFVWDGTVTVDGHGAEASVDFMVYADESGNNKVFILSKAVLKEVRLEFEDPVDIIGDFPYLSGYVHISGNKYRIYSVLDNSPNKSIINNEIFFNPLQKFQFVDERDTVIAELEKGKYTIYDTAPEAERESLQNAAALLVAFRHTALVMKNLEYRWGLPWFYRYVYPGA